MVAEVGIALAPWEVQIFHDRLAYLEYMIIPRGHEVQQAKIDALQKILASIHALTLCVFLGLANYYR